MAQSPPRNSAAFYREILFKGKCFGRFGENTQLLIPIALRSSCAARLRRQFCSTTRAIRPAALHGVAATRACGLQRRSTMRTEYKSCRNILRAARARFRQGPAQDKVENDADAIGNEKRQQGPHHIRHPAPLRVATDVAHEQHKYENEEREAKRKQDFPCRIPLAHVPVTRQCDREQENAHAEISRYA